MENGFSTVDFAIFGFSLLLSLGVGLYFALKGTRGRQQTNDELLLGDRKMPLFPTTISLMSTLVSGIMILSYPAEIYMLGTAVCWTVIGCAIALIFVAIFIIPVIYRSNHSVNAYEYFEHRFQSKAIRRYASFLFTLSTLMYMSVVLYAPSIALSGVTPIPTWVLLVVVGLLCTVYSSLGGLKAVVWTDLIQGFIMYSGLFAMVIKGTTEIGGNPHIVWEAGQNGSRTDGLSNVDPNPFQYMTVWTGLIGGTFFWMNSWGANQMTLQRYCSMASVRKAQTLALLAVPFMILIAGLAFYIGLAMYAHYGYVKQCDPIAAKLIDSKDQLVMYYMIELFHEYPGLPGLFLACLFSGTLSTVSSGVNSLSAVGFEEFGRPLLRLFTGRDANDREATLMTKVIGLGYGMLAVGLAFSCGPLGGIFQAVNSGVSAITGPLVGLLLLSVFFTWANRIGALVGITSGTFLALWIFVGAQINKHPAPELPRTVSGCSFNGSSVSPVLFNQSESEVDIYALSYFMYSVVGMVPTVVIGLAVSAATGGSDIMLRRPEMLFWGLFKEGRITPQEDFEELDMENNKRSLRFIPA